MLDRWTADNIPDLTGKRAIVTGANSGIGFVTALELAKHGCQVVMACRNLEKGEIAKQKILEVAPDAKCVVAKLDLADFSSVKQFAMDIKSSYDTISILVNNGGVLGIPYSTTKDGNETVIQTNYLSHFLLAKELLPLLSASGDARIIQVASNTHHAGKINLDDLNGEKHYSKSEAYPNSNLARLLFAFELNRRLQDSNLPIISVAAHPGYAHTDILTHENTGNSVQRAFFKLGNTLLAQSKEQGALPILLACTHPDVKGGDFYGVNGFKEMRGRPSHARVSTTAKDEMLAAALWNETEKLTQTQFLHQNLPKPFQVKLMKTSLGYV